MFIINSIMIIITHIYMYIYILLIYSLIQLPTRPDSDRLTNTPLHTEAEGHAQICLKHFSLSCVLLNYVLTYTTPGLR